MSVCLGLECAVCAGCMHWAWKRCTYIGAYDSENWPPATEEDFDPIPRVCGGILAVYEKDLDDPDFTPPEEYRIRPESIVKWVSYEEAEKTTPPYMIYADKEHKEIVLSMRGLNLKHGHNYKVIN